MRAAPDLLDSMLGSLHPDTHHFPSDIPHEPIAQELTKDFLHSLASKTIDARLANTQPVHWRDILLRLPEEMMKKYEYDKRPLSHRDVLLNALFLDHLDNRLAPHTRHEALNKLIHETLTLAEDSTPDGSYGPRWRIKKELYTLYTHPEYAENAKKVEIIREAVKKAVQSNLIPVPNTEEIDQVTILPGREDGRCGMERLLFNRNEIEEMEKTLSLHSQRLAAHGYQIHNIQQRTAETLSLICLGTPALYPLRLPTIHPDHMLTLTTLQNMAIQPPYHQTVTTPAGLGVETPLPINRESWFAWLSALPHGANIELTAGPVFLLAGHERKIQREFVFHVETGELLDSLATSPAVIADLQPRELADSTADQSMESNTPLGIQARMA